MWALALGPPFRIGRFAGRRAPQPHTFDYPFDGVAVEALVGLEYDFGPRFSVFGDYINCDLRRFLLLRRSSGRACRLGLAF